MDEVRTVAFGLMSEHGFDAVTVEHIAGQASVSPSTVYRYFGTKEALVLSADRPAQTVTRVGNDSSNRTSLEAIQRAATRVWGSDDAAMVELGLVLANPTLTTAWERQMLDHRQPVADALAARRGAKSAGTKDEACAAAGLALVMTLLPRWHAQGGGKKTLDKLLTKGFSSI